MIFGLLEILTLRWGRTFELNKKGTSGLSKYSRPTSRTRFFLRICGQAEETQDLVNNAKELRAYIYIALQVITDLPPHACDLMKHSP